MYDDFKVANYSKALLSPELFGRHLSRIFTGDVVDGLTVTPGTGMKVVLAPGNAFIRFGSAAVASARYVSLVNNFELTVGTADASNPRIDLVVVYVDNSVSLPSGTPSTANLDGKGVAKAKIVQGSPTATPAAPNGTAIQASVGSGNPYTVLAQVRVDNGVSVIAANKITDSRNLIKFGSDRLDLTALLAELVNNPRFIQTGSASLAVGGSTITFPTSFDSTPLIIATVRNTSDATPETCKITARSSANFSARGFYGSTAAGIGIDWIAINVSALAIKRL